MAQAPEIPQEKGQGPRICPHCGARAIARVVRLNQNAEIVPYRVAGISTGTEARLADLCETCGTVLRFFVKEPRRQWTA